MDLWTLLSWGAWIVSGLLFLWMLVDMLSVSKNYSEDFLMSSREGEE
jgi:hypothetical protein